MRKIILTIILLLTIEVIGGEWITSKVTRVCDGDTIVISGNRRVRLWGIDAPELDQPGGKEAARQLSALIAERCVQIELIGRDRYRRIVGVVWSGKLDLNLEMIRNGHAWYYRQYAPHARRYEEAQKIAEAEKIGLWKTANPVQPWIWRKKNRKNKKSTCVLLKNIL